MSQLWQIKFFEDEDGKKPVQEFLHSSDLTKAEIKQIQTRLRYISQSGLAILGQRSDILEKLKGPEADGLYSLRCPNTLNNPRILICIPIEQTFVLLYGFKEKNSRDYNKAIAIASKYKQKIEAQVLEDQKRRQQEETQKRVKRKGRKK